jgi:hypothetical protein
MALAVIINTTLLPGHVFAAIKLTPFVAEKATRWEQSYYDWLRQLEERQNAPKS